MFAAINISHLADSVQYWGEKAGVSGFFIDNIANWWFSRDKLFEQLQMLTEVNSRGARYGVVTVTFSKWHSDMENCRTGWMTKNGRM